ncbi:MAG: N-acetyltransferase [Chloroflexi bacterium]|nr:MAG: N-acetyltransferase [Chloroflexota bacterium]MBL1196818.1 N-acetyltransferase family protein [Chloroflexota bacterium]NOH14113.1 N-acetyltransferase [Chloroflexota bacterium]
MAKLEDAEGILSIYAPIVEKTPISFELEPPSLNEMRRRITNTIKERPWLVCEADGEILGYAYASTYRSRGAYAWAVETSAYVDEQHQRKSIARGLYTILLKILELQGYHTAFAGIALPNEASVKFHEAMGYEAIGVFRQAGFKFGKWHDVGWWQRHIGNDQSMPVGLPKPVNKLFGGVEWEEALQGGKR